MKRKDVNEIAFSTLQQAIGSIPKERAVRKATAAELGRRGGLKGGKIRAAKLSAKERSLIALHAAQARWKKNK